MQTIHTIMTTSISADPHNIPNEYLETIARKKKLSAIAFLVFGILLILSGYFLISFENERFSISFIIFGVIGILFSFVYWISAERILHSLRKASLEQARTQLHADIDHRNFQEFLYSNTTTLPTYEQIVLPHREIPPSYDEAIKLKSVEIS